jgi:nucleotide-binding universal stress UspA family protein
MPVYKISGKFYKLLVAVDGSQPSFNAAEKAIDLAKKYKAKLFGLFVVSPDIRFGYLDENSLHKLPPDLRLIVSNIITAGEGYLTAIRKKALRNRIKFESKVVLGKGSVVRTIVEFAEENGIDLIIMGTIGITGFKRLMLGSTASGVVTHAHCPVLLVR